MHPISSVEWGPTDALTRDRQFHEKWVEPDEIKVCLRKEKWLISGEKGVGKSAIRKALVEIYGQDYLVSPVVDFNDISFRVLHEHLLALANTTRLSKTSVLSHYWQYAMIVELIAAAASANPTRYGPVLSKIPKDRANAPLNERLLKLLEEAWNKIDEFTGILHHTKKSPKGSSKRANLVASAGLTANLLHDLSSFPLGPDFDALRTAFFKAIESGGDRLVLILDGFDRLKNSGTPSDATQLIFASLVDAVQVIHSDPLLPSGIEIKAFIPHDRYLALPLRDSDKVDTMHVAIRWNRKTLQAFLKRRMDLVPKLQPGGFHQAWRQIMPETITNGTYRLEEDSFDYMLRHTMMRPRQLQVHLDQLSSDYFGRSIDPSMVPPAIAESSKKIAKYFIDEFRTDYPYLGRFIVSLQKKDNVLEYRHFRELVDDGLRKYASKERPAIVEDMIDSLYAMGFFGVVNFLKGGQESKDVYCPPTKESRRHFVDFFFKNPHPTISGTLNDDSVVAFHPVFIDYCSMTPHSSLVVG